MQKNPVKPGLFGITHSNRDFTSPESWGENQFNSAFPASLLCYMGKHDIFPIYLKLDENFDVSHCYIKTCDLFGLPYNDENLFFSFELSTRQKMKQIGKLFVFIA